MQRSIVNLFLKVFLGAFALYLVPLEVSAQPGQSSLALSAPANRVVFDAVPFSTGSTVPYWDKGYLVSLTPETTAPDKPNVSLYDAQGHMTRQSVIWFQDAQTVFILSAAVTRQGSIAASGTAVRADGTRAYF